MATRTLKPHHQDDIRLKIKADRIIEWLQAGILSEKYQGKDVTLTTERVAAARVLLNKCLPDLTKAELSSPGDKPLAVTVIERVVVEPKSK